MFRVGDAVTQWKMRMLFRKNYMILWAGINKNRWELSIAGYNIYTHVIKCQFEQMKRKEKEQTFVIGKGMMLKEAEASGGAIKVLVLLDRALVRPPLGFCL